MQLYAGKLLLFDLSTNRQQKKQWTRPILYLEFGTARRFGSLHVCSHSGSNVQYSSVELSR